MVRCGQVLDMDFFVHMEVWIKWLSFADDIFNWFIKIIKILLKFISVVPNDAKSDLADVMAWHQVGDKP